MESGGRVLFLTAVVLVAAAAGPTTLDGGSPPTERSDGPAAVLACGPASASDSVRMTPSRRARSASGTMVLRLDATPFGVAVEPDGSYRYWLAVDVEGLRSRDGLHHVVWVATPELDRHRRIGTLGDDGRVEGEVTWNKFLVFVTAEERPDPESWSQRILLSALSPSGRMHTMAGHGPFSGEPCLDPRN